MSSTSFDHLLDGVAEQEWAIEDDFLPQETIDQLRHELQELIAEGEVKRAGIGRSENFTVDKEIRGDYIYWLDEKNLTDAQQQYYTKISELRQAINRDFFLSLHDFECHFASYPPGSFYKKHLDQFPQVQYRFISCILYLNPPGWQESDGGQLRIYHGSEKNFTDVLPKAGRFACFRSDSVYHEVLPATRTRYSLTGWMRKVDVDSLLGVGV